MSWFSSCTRVWGGLVCFGHGGQACPHGCLIGSGSGDTAGLGHRTWTLFWWRSAMATLAWWGAALSCIKVKQCPEVWKNGTTWGVRSWCIYRCAVMFSSICFIYSQKPYKCYFVTVKLREKFCLKQILFFVFFSRNCFRMTSTLIQLLMFQQFPQMSSFLAKMQSQFWWVKFWIPFHRTWTLWVFYEGIPFEQLF